MSLVHSPPRPPKAKVAPAPAPAKPTHTRELVFKPIEAKPKRKLPIKKLPSPKKTATRAKPPQPPRKKKATPPPKPKLKPVAASKPAVTPPPKPKAKAKPKTAARPAQLVMSRSSRPQADRVNAESLADRLRRASKSKKPARPQLAAKVRNISNQEKRRARGETFEEDPTRLWAPETLLIEGGSAAQ